MEEKRFKSVGLISFLQPLKNTHVHQDEYQTIEGVFDWDGTHSEAKIFGIIVPNNLIFNTCAGEYTIHNKERNENKQKSEIKPSQVIGFYSKMKIKKK